MQPSGGPSLGLSDGNESAHGRPSSDHGNETYVTGFGVSCLRQIAWALRSRLAQVRPSGQIAIGSES